MKTILHFTKSALESERALYEGWLSTCDDHEHCEQYQETIDAIDEALRTGEGTSFANGCTEYVMDSSFWVENL